MSHFEVRARLKIRPGQLAGFKEQAAELMRLTKELDTKTLRYDWFISDDGTQCEVHESYENEQGLIEHNEHVKDARAKLFAEFAYDHEMTAYGPVSQQLVDLSKFHAGGLGRYEFVGGLQREPTV